MPYNQDRCPGAPMPGALAESVRCSVAVGPGAAVAAARPFGRVDRYAPTLPADPAGLLGSCVLSIVDLGTVDGDDPAARAGGGPRRPTPALARVLAARPATLAGAGRRAVRHRPSRPGCTSAIADGPGWDGRLAHLAEHRPGRLPAARRPGADRAGRAGPAHAGAALRSAGRPSRSAAGRRTCGPPSTRRPTPTGRPAPSVGWPAGSSPCSPLAQVAARGRGAAAAAPGPPARRTGTAPAPVSRRVVAAVELLLVAAALAVPARAARRRGALVAGRARRLVVRRGDRRC